MPPPEARHRPAARLSRRELLGGGAALAGWALAGEALAWQETTTGDPHGAAAAHPPGRPADSARADRAYAVRLKAADLARGQAAPRRAVNGDEEALGASACYSKALPHDRLGIVDAASYRLLRQALASTDPRDFESIPLGGQVKLANPQGAFAFGLIGPDAARVDLPAPPSFSSAEQAAEAVELYWQAHLRDVPFADYETHPLAGQAAADLSHLAGFRGPREGGRVTPRTLFRGAAAGDLAGPYVSQFLWKDIPFTPIRAEQRVRVAVAGLDYLTAYDDWLACQNGAIAGVNRFDARPSYIRSGRDLGEFVHRDFSFQGALTACLILLKAGAPLDGGNPYKHSRTQSGFATFGSPYLFFLLATVTQAALGACWYQKWLMHRRIRPEELGGRLEILRAGRARYPLHADLLASGAVAEALRRRGNALLPQAYPEACPTHPSYPAGHAVIAGAGVTVLKALFDESHIVPTPVVPAPDGLSLKPYAGAPLTVGDELDKLASNIAMGRNFAGIHWRSDMTAGLAMGEEVALAVLAEMRLTGNEVFSGWSLRRFDGRRVTV